MPEWLVYISYTLLIVYSILIFTYTYWFKNLQPFQPKSITPITAFSIIIPARDEAENISALLQSIFQNNYPSHLFEVIIVDDHSTDNTAEIVKQWQLTYQNIQLIHLKEYVNAETIAYKKLAIEIAIQQAQYNWIVTTDADCIVPQQWLINLNAYILQNPTKQFIAAPVSFIPNQKLSGIFQVLDFLSLQGITAASVSAGLHTLCNGANLAYSKTIFKAVDGFANINQIASGDDMLLMQKIKRLNPTAIGYLFATSSIVQTHAMPTWKRFLQQRIRWASKSKHYKDVVVQTILAMVFFFNLCLLLFMLGMVFQPTYWKIVLVCIGFKTLVEAVFMYPVAQFFKQEKWLIWFPIMQPFHILYIVSTALFASWGSYEWKNRKLH